MLSLPIASLLFLGPSAPTYFDFAGQSNITANHLTGDLTEDDPNLFSPELWKSSERDEIIEDQILDYAPNRASAMLVKAQVERLAIRASNLIFHWNCIPTFYGSDILFLPHENVLMGQASALTGSDYEALVSFAFGLSSVAQKYPDRNFFIYVAEHSRVADCNPSLPLVNSACTIQELLDVLQQNTEANNVHFVRRNPLSIEDYKGDFFQSDHHWNGQGAERAFSELMAMAGKELEQELSTKKLDQDFYGSFSREGLCIMNSSAVVPSKLPSSIILTNLAGKEEDASRHLAYTTAPEDIRLWSFYDYYFNFHPHISGIGEGRALLIGDSYCRALERLFGLTYQETFCKDDLQQSPHDDGSLAEYIENTDATDIFFVASPDGYIYQSKRNENLWDDNSDSRNAE